MSDVRHSAIVKLCFSSIFTYAKQSGVLDGINPVEDAAIPSRAAKAKSRHATSISSGNTG